jgi:shikimate 5-dehydrogenase
VKFALIGHPVSHSLSPAIHQAAYRELGLSHDYELIDCGSEADVDRVVQQVRSGALAGVNVTIPWKRRACAVADRRSRLAERLGVANVLALDAGGIMAHNTDALALEAEFKRLASTSRALVLGSGGAVPAVVAACQAAGIADVMVTARRYLPDVPAASWPGTGELSGLGARLLAWPAASSEAARGFAKELAETGLVVQCTSAGMQGADSGEPLAAMVPWQVLPPDALAYDLVYVPLETPFLRAARMAGRRTAHGLDMLVGQAIFAIELWLGQRPPAEPLRRAALQALEARRS